MSADEFARKKEAVSQAIADKQIGQLKRAHQASEPTDPEYPDYLFRLADHHLDKKAYFEMPGRMRSTTRSTTPKRPARRPRRSSSRAAKEVRASLAKKSSADAAKVYQVLVTKRREFAKYKRLD